MHVIKPLTTTPVPPETRTTMASSAEKTSKSSNKDKRTQHHPSEARVEWPTSSSGAPADHRLFGVGSAHIPQVHHTHQHPHPHPHRAAGGNLLSYLGRLQGGGGGGGGGDHGGPGLRPVLPHRAASAALAEAEAGGVAALGNGGGGRDREEHYSSADAEIDTDRPSSTVSSASATSGKRTGGGGGGGVKRGTGTGRGRPPGGTGTARKEQLRAARTERKRCREKKRRSDVNRGFDDLTTLVMRIDPGGGEDGDGSEGGGGAGGSSPDGDRDQPPANRVALIARTVRVLEQLHEENAELKRRLRRREGGVSSLPSPTSSSAKTDPGGHAMAEGIAEKVPSRPQHGNEQDRRRPGAAGTGGDDTTLLVPVMIPWDGTSSRPPLLGPLNHDHSVPLSQVPAGSVFPLSTPFGSGTRDALLRYSSAAAALEEISAGRRPHSTAALAAMDLRQRRQQSAADLDMELRHRQQMVEVLRYQQSTARLGIPGGDVGLASEAAIAAAARENVAAETARLRHLEMEVLSRAAAERRQHLGQSSPYGGSGAGGQHSRRTEAEAEAEAEATANRHSSASDLPPRNPER